MTIDEIYKRRINYYREKFEYPKLFLVTEEERDELIKEALLMDKKLSIYVSNIYDFIQDGEFKLFNTLISTEERERK